MSDFIKEFNMIDFMGMIFPGSVMVLLFGAETDLWYKMETLWGAAPEMAAKLVFIIVMGYFAGMLLHHITAEMAKKWFITDSCGILANVISIPGTASP